MNLISLTLIGTGAVLIYSAVKGYDPRDVVRAALAGKAPSATVTKAYSLSPTTDAVPPASGL